MARTACIHEEGCALMPICPHSEFIHIFVFGYISGFTTPLFICAMIEIWKNKK